MRFTKQIQVRDLNNYDIFVFRGSTYYKSDDSLYRFTVHKEHTLDPDATVQVINNMDMISLSVLILSMKDDRL